MKYEEIARVDLNLLKTLKLLGEERNTRRVAERMFVGQSTVSKSLKKLRELLDDELFVREAYGLRPTERCEQVLAKLPTLFEVIESTLSPAQGFDPENYRGEFTIALNAAVYQPIYRLLYPKLRKLAPNAEVRFINWTWDTEAKLQQGDVTLGVNMSLIDVSQSLHYEPVCEAQYKLCCTKDSPFVREGFSLDSFRKHPLILMVMPNMMGGRTLVEQVLLHHQIVPRISFRSDQLDVCLDVLRKEPAGMPVTSLIRPLLGDDLTLLPIPEDLPVLPAQVAIYFPKTFIQNAKVQWLKQQVADTILELNGQE